MKGVSCEAFRGIQLQSALLHKTSLFLIVFDALNKSAIDIGIGVGIGVMMLQ